MGNIKSKFFTIVMFIIFFMNLFLIINNELFVKAAEAKVFIDGEPTYKQIKDIIKNNEIIGKIYEINVTLNNKGLDVSDELTVNLTDEEHFSLSKKIILNPGETKIVSFIWSTLLIKNQEIIVSFYPSNPDIDWNQYNSGSKTFTVYITDKNEIKATSTPGFEIVYLIIALIFIFLLKNSDKS